MSLINLLSRLNQPGSQSLSSLAALSSPPSTASGFAAHTGHSALLWLQQWLLE